MSLIKTLANAVASLTQVRLWGIQSANNANVEAIESTGAALRTYETTAGAGDRLSANAAESYKAEFREWRRQIINTTSPTAIQSDGYPVIIGGMRVNGAAALGGAAIIAAGTIASNVEQERLAATSAVGVQLDFFGGSLYSGGCVVTVNTSGSVIVYYKLAA